MKSPWRRAAAVVAAMSAAAWAARELVVQLRRLDAHAVQSTIVHTPLQSVVGSLLFTALSFGGLAMIEVLACRLALGTRISTRRALRGGAIAHALCNTLGFHVVLAPALRFMLYRRGGADGWAIARLLAVVGAALVAGAAMAASVAALAQAFGLAGLFAALVAMACAPAALARLPERWRARIPAAMTAIAPRVVAVALLESAFAMAALYVLMPEDIQAMPARFVLVFVGSAALGVVSHSPGGVGVFEAGMLAALPGDRARLLAALLVFRLVYNLLPAAIAAPALAVDLRRGISSTADTSGSRDAAPGTGAPVRPR